jgi:uncharacterized FlgJ-related protein
MKKIIHSLTIVMILDLLQITTSTNYNVNKLKFNEVNIDSLFEKNKIEIYLLYFEILENNIQYPDIALAQAILESGYMTSQIFIENNNLFGMRFPERRETTAISENKGYSVYDCWTDSVKDYKLFQDFLFRNKEKTRDEYFDYLSRIYAEDGSYVFFVKKIIKDTEYIINDDNYIILNQIKNSPHYLTYNKKICDFIKEKKIV